MSANMCPLLGPSPRHVCDDESYVNGALYIVEIRTKPRVKLPLSSFTSALLYR